MFWELPVNDPFAGASGGADGSYDPFGGASGGADGSYDPFRGAQGGAGGGSNSIFGPPGIIPILTGAGGYHDPAQDPPQGLTTSKLITYGALGLGAVLLVAAIAKK